MLSTNLYMHNRFQGSFCCDLPLQELNLVSARNVVTKEVVEAISSDIISEVDMDRDMRLSQRIVDELLSIYM